YHVLLWDDDHHTYDYVVRMLAELFGKSMEDAFLMAVEVDSQGRVVVETTHKEKAELMRDQIHAYGKDSLIASCAGSMWATIEPETKS
ncbi:MAG: ATP-dependent Clp protease adaptor ClpS, partial [Planctomycetales bacterium]